MDEKNFKHRTKRFALEIVDLVETLPRRWTTDTISRQLLRAGTSVGANYRAACRGRSVADMIAKLRIVEEECDEAVYWMELLVESRMVPLPVVAGHMREANELISMIVASIKTMQKRSR
jgi:four helix bundle protein